MEKPDEDSIVCDHCNNAVKDDDDFCPECGSIFIDDVYCDNHKDIIAKGVCIICSVPYCKKCGTMINNHFLCNPHSNYEIFEGTTKIYGTVDETDVLYVKNCLEQNRLHPVLLYRHSLYGGSGFSYPVFKGTKSDIKVMVPFQEVSQAEEILKTINT